MSEKVFVLDKSSAEDVARAMIEGGRQKEAFFVLDLDEINQRIQYFKQSMPRVQIFYAMKSNDSESILKLAVTNGLGFDCASPGEINKILQLNVNPLSIIFAVPTKAAHWMTYAKDVGVRHTTFDTSYELKKIKQYWPNALLLIRIKVEGDSIYKLGDKFGCDFDTEAINLLDEAAALNLKVVGVAFHVGSACSSADSHQIGLRRAKTLFDHEEKSGRKMTIVDIGGGFLSDRTDRIDQVSKLVNDTLEDLFPDPIIQIIAEPGRYICDSSMTLYCSISNVRKIIKGEQKVNMIYMDHGLFGTLRYIEPWHIVKRFENKTDKEISKPEPTILWGPSCDSTDRVMENITVTLPLCSPLDWLVFPIHGAYSLGFATNFSCLGITLFRTVISRSLWNIIKCGEVFLPEQYNENPDLSEPLPSILPKLHHAEWFFDNNILQV